MSSISASKNHQCTTTTVLLILALILGVIGLAFIYTVVGVVIGIVVISIACIFFLASVIMLLNLLVNQGFKAQSRWCQFNIVFCLIVFVVLIAFAAVGGVEHQNQLGVVTPVPSNEASTAPSPPSP